MLGPEMLRRRPDPSAATPVARVAAALDAVAARPREEDLKPARVCPNECILFDESRQTSWIIYPPRSAYDFVRRPTSDTTIVEHHPWSPMERIAHHPLSAASGCSDHGVDCGANVAIRAAIRLGWDPFR